MDESRTTLLVVGSFGLLAVLVTIVSILILSGGKVYQKIPEASRPRRWVVAIFFSYFVMFCLWFPSWFLNPRSIVSRVLSVMFSAFTVFIAAWCVLGRIKAILLPVIAVVEWIRESYRYRSQTRRH